MKKIFVSLTFILLSVCVWARTERVFVVTDRTAYLSGDRVWCSLFCVDGNGRLSEQSAVAYLELVSADGTVQEAKISLLGGRGCGEFNIPVQVPTGNYRLVAYTGGQGAEGAQLGSRLLSVYNTFSLARVSGGVVTGEAAAAAPQTEVNEGVEVSVPRKVRTERPFTAMVKGVASDVTLSVFHIDGLEQVSPATLSDFLQAFPVSSAGKGVWEYDGEVVKGSASGAPAGSVAILSSAGSPEDTYFALVEEDGSLNFPTGNIFGDREMVCAVPEAGDQVRIRLENPYLRPAVKNVPALRLHEDQYSALVNRKNALYTISGADTLYSFLPRRQDLLLTGVTWERYHLDDYTRFHSVQEILVEILPTVRLRRGQLEVSVPDGAGVTRQFRDRVLVMMDGVVVPDMNLLLNLDAMLLEDVYVCTQPLVSSQLVYNGVVNFVSKKNYVKALNFPENVYVLDFKGVRYPVAYLGAVPTVSDGRDVRQLLYWHPSLQIKEGETVRIPLTAPAYSGRFCIVAEGLSTTGKPVRSVTTFEVE